MCCRPGKILLTPNNPTIVCVFGTAFLPAGRSQNSTIIGGHNYGQGSSREHAALAPMYLGIKAVFAKSFARIHHANLVNFGILPLTFVSEADYDEIGQDDLLEIRDLRAQLQGETLTVHNLTGGKSFTVRHGLPAPG